jgi:Ni,Fe-hydrogenase III large subunit
LALSAFERESGIVASRSACISRMILLEMDKIYFYITKLCHTLRHYGLSSELLSSSQMKLQDFISENIKTKNIFKLEDEFFSKDFYENYLGLKVFLEKNITSSRKLLLRGLFNRMELKSHFLGAVVDKSSLKGSAIRWSGVNYNFKLDTDFLFYKSLNLNRNIKNENSLYGLYDIMFQELLESLDITENVLLNSPHLGFCFDNFSDYDLNNINDEACFEIETAHGIASIVLYKNSNNRISYQLSTESLNRLYFFESNLKNYEFSAQDRILDNLAIEFNEIY